MAETDKSATNLQYVHSRRARCVGHAERRIFSDVLDMLFRGNVRALSESCVAAALGYSERQFRRIWWEIAGEALGLFVRRIRLERSAGMLSGSAMGIAGIARATGFSSVQAFSKAFTAHFGCAPTEFRNLNQNKECFLPGFLLGEDQQHDLPSHVKIRTGLNGVTTFIFDGPILLAKVLPSGRIDWRPK